MLGLYHLKWLILVQIPLYILTETSGYLLPGPRQLLYIAGSWRGSPTGQGSVEGLWPSPRKVWDFFTWNASFLVQIQLYFNRNVGQFTARTTTVTIYMYCWRPRGRHRSNQSTPPPSLQAGAWQTLTTGPANSAVCVQLFIRYSGAVRCRYRYLWPSGRQRASNIARRMITPFS